MTIRNTSSLPFFSYSLAALLATSSFASSAVAQDEVEDSLDDLDEDEAEDSLDDLDEDEAEDSFDDLDEDEAEDVEEDERKSSVPETPIDEGKKKDGKFQLLMGMRYRALITPKFLMNMFGVDGGRTIFVNGFGPEVGAYWKGEKDGFTLMFSPWVAYYNMDSTPFKGTGDPAAAWELIDSDMHVWYLTVDTMWDHEIVDRFSFAVGGSWGIGIVGGELRRNEAYQTGGFDEQGVPNLALCAAPLAPGLPGTPNPGECPADGNYDITGNTTTDPWPVYPWINFQMGLRYQPIDEFVARFDMGVGSAGFWLGLGADYSLFL